MSIRKKIKLTQTIHKDGEHEFCYDCRKLILGTQYHCNCGCDEVWCQPHFLKHYKNTAMNLTFKKWSGA